MRWSSSVSVAHRNSETDQRDREMVDRLAGLVDEYRRKADADQDTASGDDDDDGAASGLVPVG